jgi:hypothetical protein
MQIRINSYGGKLAAGAALGLLLTLLLSIVFAGRVLVRKLNEFMDFDGLVLYFGYAVLVIGITWLVCILLVSLSPSQEVHHDEPL